MGVGLAELVRLLDVLLPCQAPSVAALGRWTKAAVQDEYPWSSKPDGLWRLSGRLTEHVKWHYLSCGVGPFAEIWKSGNSSGERRSLSVEGQARSA
jgi:hypothetical protein